MVPLARITGEEASPMEDTVDGEGVVSFSNKIVSMS